MIGEPRGIAVNGQKTRLLEVGEGPVVLVLHGWGGRIESMAPAISCLSARLRVVAIDLPGFGESPAPDGWGTPEYADFVDAVMSDLGIDKAHLLGHSYGAKTSLCLAATRPERVDRMVLVGSSGLRSAPSPKVRMKRSISRAAKKAGALGPPGRAVRDAVFDRIASDDYKNAGAMRPILVKVVNEDFTDLLPRVKASTLLVWGTEDDSVPVAHARTMEKLIPDAGLVLFEGAGHFAYLDDPDRFCRIVRHFFGVPIST